MKQYVWEHCLITYWSLVELILWYWPFESLSFPKLKNSLNKKLGLHPSSWLCLILFLNCKKLFDVVKPWFLFYDIFAFCKVIAYGHKKKKNILVFSRKGTINKSLFYYIECYTHLNSLFFPYSLYWIPRQAWEKIKCKQLAKCKLAFQH